VPKINVYLPDELAHQVRDAGIPVSPICQRALAEALRGVARARRGAQLLRDPSVDLATTPQLVTRLESLMTLRLRESVRLGDTMSTIETKHLLTGILDEGHNLAVKVLQTMEVDVDDLRLAAATVAFNESPPQHSSAAALSRLTSEGRGAFASALDAAIDLGHNYLGTEHLLLGLLDAHGAAATVLASFGIEAGATRRTLASALAGFALGREAAASPSDAATLDAIVRRLDQLEARIASLSDRAGPVVDKTV
jgi:ATP-dependent Clp protease ATP-binding subunit ClpA